MRVKVEDLCHQFLQSGDGTGQLGLLLSFCRSLSVSVSGPSTTSMVTYGIQSRPACLSVSPPSQWETFYTAKTNGWCCLAKGLCNTVGSTCCKPYADYWAQRYAAAERFLLLPLPNQTLEQRLGKIPHKIITHAVPKTFAAEFAALWGKDVQTQTYMTRKKKTEPVTLVTPRLNLRQAWSTPACRARSKDLDWLKTGLRKSASAKVQDAEPGVSAGFAAALPSSGSSAHPLARPPHSTSISFTQRRGLSPLRETTLCGDESQRLFQPSPSHLLLSPLKQVLFLCCSV